LEIFIHALVYIEQLVVQAMQGNFHRMAIGKNIHAWGFAGFLLQLAACFIYYSLRFNRLTLPMNTSSLVLITGTLAAFFVLALGHKKTHQERVEGKAPSSNDLEKEAVKVLSTLYTVVAGLSLTTAIRETSSLGNVFSFWGAVVFFSIALPFYHGATMFLVTNYYAKGFERRRKEPLIDFLLLFFEAGALYNMAINITNSYQLVYSFSLLLLIDVVWILFMIGRKWRNDVPREWIWLNFYMFLFIVPFLFLSEQNTWGLAFVTISRTLTDYYVAHQFYLPSV
jgi:hypothetical protein